MIGLKGSHSNSHVFASAGAGLWTTANDQYKFYKMLMNLGIGDNGVRILKDEPVKSILAVSTRPAGLGGYSLGLTAPLAEKDGENAWFGHGGPPPGRCISLKGSDPSVYALLYMLDFGAADVVDYAAS